MHVREDVRASRKRKRLFCGKFQVVNISFPSVLEWNINITKNLAKWDGACPQPQRERGRPVAALPRAPKAVFCFLCVLKFGIYCMHLIHAGGALQIQEHWGFAREFSS